MAEELVKAHMQMPRPSENDRYRRAWEHPRDVAELVTLIPSGLIDDEFLQVAWLHDFVEDAFKPQSLCRYTAQDLLNFGFAMSVVEDVIALSKPAKASKSEYLTDLRKASVRARMVKVCDRICNLRDGVTSGFTTQWRLNYCEETRRHVMGLVSAFATFDMMGKDAGCMTNTYAWAAKRLIDSERQLFQSASSFYNCFLTDNR
jgi:(p)ppGpp synthase/HD superfamily hydrolase